MFSSGGEVAGFRQEEEQKRLQLHFFLLLCLVGQTYLKCLK